MNEHKELVYLLNRRAQIKAELDNAKLCVLNKYPDAICEPYPDIILVKKREKQKYLIQHGNWQFIIGRGTTEERAWNSAWSAVSNAKLTSPPTSAGTTER